MRRWGRSFSSGAAIVAIAMQAWAVDPASASKDERAGAQKTFQVGAELYGGHHYEEALAAFRASYQIVASPNSALMIARCLRDLGRIPEAYREYGSVVERAAQSGDHYKSTGEAATEELGELKTKIALLTVRVADSPAGVTVKVGRKTLEPDELGAALPFEPGPTEVTAEGADGSSAREDVTLTAGASSDVELRLVKPLPAAHPPVVLPPPKAPPPAPSPLRTWAYVAGGIGGAGLVTFTIFGVMTASKYSSLESACPDGRCPPGKQADVDAGKTDQLIANVGLGVGIAGVAAGTTLFLLSLLKRDDGVHVGFGLGSATVSGRF